jgi:hypothetical protein
MVLGVKFSNFSIWVRVFNVFFKPIFLGTLLVSRLACR